MTSYKNKEESMVVFFFLKAIKLSLSALHNLIYTLLIFLSTAKFQIISPKAAWCFTDICRLLGVVSFLVNKNMRG